MDFLDTNIFLEVFVRSGPKSEKSLNLLKTATNLYTSWLVISELEWVLRSVYKKNKKEIAKMLNRVVMSKNIEIEQKNLLVESIGYYEVNKADWVDCLDAVWVKSKKYSKVISYDKDYDKFRFINRKEP